MTITTKRELTESEVPGKRLGRHVLHDDRSRAYVADQFGQVKSVEHAVHGLPLSQKRGSCTAEALIGALDSDPDYTGKQYTQEDADALYDKEIVLEGGDPATDDPGGSGLMVCKAAKQMGLIASYRHTFSLEQALRALVICPVITGVDWYESFDEPDSNALVTIAPGAGVRGGHEIVAVQIIAEERLVGLENSWGPSYGKNGRFFWSFDTWSTLLRSYGDVTVPYTNR